ncbi:MAG: AMIN domain-containing protein, partial [Acidobacteriota bacterium]
MKIRLTEKSTFGINSLKRTKLCILLFILSLGVPLLTSAMEPSGSQGPQPKAILTDIAASQSGGTLTVTLKTNRVLEPKSFRLDNPPRLVIDFQNTENRVPFMKLPLKSEAADQLRVSQFQSTEPQIARVVFDLGKNPVGHKISLDSDSVKVTLQPEDSHTDKPEISPVTSVKTADKNRLSEKTSVKTETVAPAAKPVAAKPTFVPQEKSVEVAATSLTDDTVSEAPEIASRAQGVIAKNTKEDSGPEAVSGSDKLNASASKVIPEPKDSATTPEPNLTTPSSEKPETANINMPSPDLGSAKYDDVKQNTKTPALIASLEAGTTSLAMANAGG